MDDGICDCCDGTDEGGPLSCEDACAVEAAAAAAKAKAEASKRARGARKRLEMACEARRDIAAARASAAQARAALAAEERTVKTLEAEVSRAQQKSADAVETDARRRLYKAFGLEKLSADELRTLVVDVARETRTAEALRRLARLANGLHDPVDEPEEQPKASSHADGEPSVESPVDEAGAPDGDLANEEDVYDIEPAYLEAMIDDEEDIPGDVLPEDDDDETAAYDDGDDSTNEASATEPEEESLSLATYRRSVSSVIPKRERKALEKLEEKLKRYRHKLKKHKSKADKAEKLLTGGAEYAGVPEDRALLALRETCLKRTTRGYTYEICLFDKARQGQTRLGVFKRVETTERGTTRMVFEHGELCYNGPTRSLRVDLVCGASNEILDLDEPATCVYVAIVATPAVCEVDDTVESFVCDDRPPGSSLWRFLDKLLPWKTRH